MISPILFDIASEEMIDDLLLADVEQDDIYFYTDDLAVVCDFERIGEIIDTIFASAEKIGLIPNIKKSAFMRLAPRRVRKQIALPDSIRCIPHVTEYKYLGVYVSEQFGLGRHLSHVSAHVNKLIGLTAVIRKNLSVDQRRILWSALIKPHIAYVGPLMKIINPSERRKWASLLIRSYKSFLGLRVTTKTEIIASL
eukprot:TRINITY_DN8658_c0_g1_i1.p1 TRINITY_DN8658_c0_g1~~TRINITY_DN8658_c0_g1_i1.p1  ORF type:complete len:196 (-),score=29.39 TRINITY_DN8658_c0_g1_i1:257-844(-)